MPDERPESGSTAPHRPALPDRDIELLVRNVSGTWGALRFNGPGQLRLTSRALILEAPRGASLHAAFDELSGGAWRSGTLVIHGGEGQVTMETDAGLEHVWVTLVRRACPLPEFTRSFRLLGSRRGGPPELQARFLAPLLQARRQLHEEQDLERRIAILSAAVISTRLREAIRSAAEESHRDSAPDRRALAVELEEALTPVFKRLEHLDACASRYHEAGEPRRFLSWRQWVEVAASVFEDADHAWGAAAPLLPARVSR